MKSIGSTRPKASVVDVHGRLAIAKFSKDSDDSSVEIWEHMALALAARAGIVFPLAEQLLSIA